MSQNESFTAAFRASLNRLFPVEGGYSNNPSDPGGATNYGITEYVARKYGYEGGMQDIPLDLVQTIYWKEFWVTCNCETLWRLAPRIAYAVFDTAVNMGATKASLKLQIVLNATNWNGPKAQQLFVPLKTDGNTGPNTLSALQKFLEVRTTEGVEVLLAYYCALRLSHYISRTEEDSMQREFAYGWGVRVCDL